MPVSAPSGPPNGADECTMQTTSPSQTTSGHQTCSDEQDHAADAGQHDQHPLDGEVVEVAGVLHDGVDQPPLLAFVGDERVPLDDLGLLQHADELRQQQTAPSAPR